jgi:hypothetical protein
MKKLICFNILFFFVINSCISQQFFPLKVGNKFVYLYQWSSSYGGHGSSGSYFEISRIEKDSSIRGKKYFMVSYIPYCQCSNKWVRVDSLTGSLYCYDSTNSCQYYYYEKLIDSLQIVSGSMQNNCADGWYFVGFGNTNLFGFTTVYKTFNIYHAPYLTEGRNYSSKFGICSYAYSFHQGMANESGTGHITGCIINDTLYGDTSTTFIRTISCTIPDRFSLSQNYPNPFNPSTIISYQVESYKVIKLVVYDILGKEVAILVNEKQSPGTYEVTWDGSNYPSGIYFYSLFADGNLIETKKMILLK